jgi:hypothetical protein
MSPSLRTAATIAPPKAPNKPLVRDDDMLDVGYTAISKSYPSDRKYIAGVEQAKSND